MSRKNSREAKAARRITNRLKHASNEWNRPNFRMIDGKLYKGVRPYRDFVQEYADGLIYVREIGRDIEIKPSMYYLAEKIAAVQGSKILVKLNYEPRTIDQIDPGIDQANTRGDSHEADRRGRDRDDHQRLAPSHSPQR